jgi:DNA topoisomerase-1
MMEERGLGTKATRADIIQKLFDRGYVYGNPPIPSETGIAMYEAFSNYVPEMATPEMTAKLEAEMDQIASGEMTKESVVGDSRALLHKTTTEIEKSREDLAKVVWAGMDEDKYLGPCKVCEEAGRKRDDGSPNRLRIIELKGGKRMYGCEGWKRDDPESPDSCPVSGPLPGRGYDLWRLEERCSICGERPRLTVKAFRGRPWKLCLNDDCPSMVEMRQKRAEREAARNAAKAMKAAAGEGGEDGAEGAGAEGAPKPKRSDTGTRRRKRTRAATKT